MKGEVFAHDTETGQTLRLTGMDSHQGSPVIGGQFIAWMDERNGSSTHDVGPGPHNSDIYVYDLETDFETRATGKGPQIIPLLSDRWLAYGKASDAEAEFRAVRYR